MVTSGDVVLRFAHDLPILPKVDVLALGMAVDSEIAQHFGVFFARNDGSDDLSFCLQKPFAKKRSESSPVRGIASNRQGP
jgi:hypothetical protein